MPVNAEKIRQLRERKGLTQEEAANAAGLKGRQAWCNFESGLRGSLRVDTLEKIADVLGVHAGELLTRRRRKR